MPLYTYQCRESGKRFDRFASMVKSAAPNICACHAVGDRVIVATRISRDFNDYQCPITGDRVSGRRQHEENLKVHGCRVYEPSERDTAAAVRKADDTALDKLVEESVERQFEALPSVKKEKLANELLSGSDLAVNRG